MTFGSYCLRQECCNTENHYLSMSHFDWKFIHSMKLWRTSTSSSSYPHCGVTTYQRVDTVSSPVHNLKHMHFNHHHFTCFCLNNIEHFNIFVFSMTITWHVYTRPSRSILVILTVSHSRNNDFINRRVMAREDDERARYNNNVPNLDHYNLFN